MFVEDLFILLNLTREKAEGTQKNIGDLLSEAE